MAHTVIGFFKNSSDAYNAVEVLQSRGFEDSNIDVSSSYENADYQKERSSKIGNFFKSLFSDDDKDVNRYSEAAKNNTMVTVHTFSDDEAERVADILDEYGSIDVDEKGYTDTTSDYAQRETSWTSDDVTDTDYTQRETSVSDSFSDRGYTERSTNLSDDRDFDSTNETLIPIIEEHVNVGKREVRQGGVRIKSRIIEKPVEETLRLREERVHVERTPVDRPTTDSELENFREETIEVHETSEVPIVSKQSRVVEEVRVGKEVVEREETIRETERRTEVDVEEFEKSHHERD